MTVMLNLKPKVEAEIAQKAAAEGTRIFDSLEKMIEGAIRPGSPVVYSQEQLAKNQAALAMLEEWVREDETNDPDEIARRQVEWEEFRQGMNENHTFSRVLFP